jgi:GntR family transcriptional regulator
MSDNRPVYLRLREQIAAAIIEGPLRRRRHAPSVRAFAAEQGANPLTVAKAYQQFQADGLIRVQRGVGMFVGEGAADRPARGRAEQFPRAGMAADPRADDAARHRPADVLHEA